MSVCSFRFVSLSDGNGVGGVGRLGPNGASPAADSRLEFGACLQLAAQRPQDVEELTPELYTHKGIQDWVEAAVEVTQGGGHCLGFLQRFHSNGRAAVAGKCVYHERDVVWCPAEKENHHHGHDDPESFLLLEALGAAL